MNTSKTVAELPVTDVWDFVEKFYPNYHSSSEIAVNNDLCKIVNQEYEANDEAEQRLHLVYGSDPENPQIKIDYNASLVSIYETAIIEYLISNKCSKLFSETFLQSPL